MPETTGPKQDRAASGRFHPGVSGNPAGRPRGARNRATLIARDLLDSDSEDLVKTAIKRARKGDPVALRPCIERRVLLRRSGSAALELPEIAKAEDVAEAARAVIAAAARGELTLSEAREWM